VALFFVTILAIGSADRPAESNGKVHGDMRSA
jgi:hypothetical protein